MTQKKDTRRRAAAESDLMRTERVVTTMSAAEIAEMRTALAREIYAAMLPELKISELATAKVVAAKRSRKQFPLGCFPDTGMYRQPPSEISDFVADEVGVLCRQRITSGETPKLPFEGSLMNQLEISPDHRGPRHYSRTG
jgi:hypothetical protein